MRMRRILITGCLGFTGRYLLELLRQRKNLCLYGIDIKLRPADGELFSYSKIDLDSGKDLFCALKEIKPHVIFHCAGRTTGTDYESFHRDNVRGTINLLEAVLKLHRVSPVRPIIIDIGSSAEYGRVRRADIPISEGTLLNPVSHYGISKMVQGLVALRYHFQQGLKIIHTRTFNLTGPGLPPNFVCGSITAQIAGMEHEEPKKRVLRVGNLESIRDFVDVRDAVKAYWILALKGRPGEIYNVCSGKGTSISRVIDMTLSSVRYPVRIIPRLQPHTKDDVPFQIGDNSKIRSLGWKPAITIRQSLRDMIQYSSRFPL